MSAFSGYLIAVLIQGASVTLPSEQPPAFLHNHSPAVLSLYQTVSRFTGSKEDAAALMQQVDELITSDVELELADMIVISLAMQSAINYQPDQVEQIYASVKSRYQHSRTLRNYFFSCTLSGRQKLRSTIKALRYSLSMPSEFEEKLSFIGHTSDDEELLSLANTQYGEISYESVYQAFLYRALTSQTLEHPNTVALLLRNLALAHNQIGSKSLERRLIVLIRELETQNIIPRLSSGPSVYSYLNP
jgi:hypothetical protein